MKTAHELKQTLRERFPEAVKRWEEATQTQGAAMKGCSEGRGRGKVCESTRKTAPSGCANLCQF